MRVSAYGVTRAGQIVRTVLRRWYIALLCLGLAAGALALHLRADAVYWGRVEILLVGPGEGATNPLPATDESLIYFSSALALAVNRGVPPEPTNSVYAPLYGSGLASGTRVRVSNVGTQWQAWFDRPVLIVEAMDPSETRAAAMMDDLLSRIRAELTRIQDEQGIVTTEHIRAVQYPEQASIVRVSGSRIRAMVMTGVLGLGSAGVASMAVDRWAARRRSRDTSTNAGTG